MKTRRNIVLGLVLMLGVAASYYWLHPIQRPRPAIFSSYSDNFAGMWGLTLYHDGGFTETLPGSHESGRFVLRGDTVELYFTDSAHFLPTAYCIVRSKQQIFKLRRGPGRWLADDTGRDWSAIQMDLLPSPRF